MEKIIKKPEIWLAILILGHVLINFIWLTIDKTPPAWDQAAHIRSVILASRGGNFADLVRSFGGYPPLIYLVGGVWANIFGINPIAITVLNSLFLVLATVGVFFLGGWLPSLLFSLLPVIYDISRSFLLDLPLTVWVVWGLYFWLKSEDLKNKYAWGLLLMLILSSLTKLNGFLYFVPIGLWLLVKNFKREDAWLKLVGGGLVYLGAVGWWWALNWQNIFQYLTGLAGTGESLTDPMDLISWVTWIHYFRLFFLHQVGPITGILAVISWFNLPKDRRNTKLIVWAIGVYLVFTVVKNKDFRFTMPILPIIALWLGQWLRELKNKWVVVVLVTYLMVNFVENSFGWPVKKPLEVITPTFLMGDIDWINFSNYPVRAASKEVWPTRNMVKEMITMGVKKVLVLVDTAEVSDNTLKMYREMLTNKGDKALEMHSIYSPGFNRWNEFEAVVVGSKNMEPAPFYATNLAYLKQAKDYVWQNLEKFEVLKSFELPNKQQVYLMRIK